MPCAAARDPLPQGSCQGLIHVQRDQAVMHANFSNIVNDVSETKQLVASIKTTLDEIRGAQQEKSFLSKLIAPILGAITGWLAGHFHLA